MRNIEYEDIRWGKRTPYKAIESERDVCEWYCANTKAIHRLHGALGLLRSVFWPNRFSRFSMYTFYFCAVCVFFYRRPQEMFSGECHAFRHFRKNAHIFFPANILSPIDFFYRICRGNRSGVKRMAFGFLIVHISWANHKKMNERKKREANFVCAIFFPVATCWKKKANNTSHWYALINYKKNSLCKQTNEQTVAGNW